MALSSRQKTFFCLALLALFIPSTTPALPTLSSARAPLPPRPFVSRGAVAPAPSTAATAPPPVRHAIAGGGSGELVPSGGAVAGAMPLATVDPGSGALALHPPALQALASLPAPLCVLSVAGASHEGKSSFLNMLSSWIDEKWQTHHGPGPDFPVGESLLDAGTEGMWLRVFQGKEGQPLPGTECRSLALIDSQGANRDGLTLDPNSGRASEDTAANRLFTLTTVASSTVALNIMSPVLNQMAQLSSPLLAAKRFLSKGFEELTLTDLPSLLVLGRDAPTPSPYGASNAGGGVHGGTRVDGGWSGEETNTNEMSTQSLDDLQLEYAMLQPRGDHLDTTRKALATLFHPSERSLTQMAMPDASDLEALSRGQTPPAYNVPGVYLSGYRPFYSSFQSAAAQITKVLRPKTIGGHYLPGRELANAMVSLVDTINQDGPASLQKSVYDYLSQQAKDAVAAGVQSGIDSLRSQLLPVLSQLPGATTDGTSAGAAAAGAGAAGAGAHTASTTTLTPELLDQTLRNATEAAYDEFVRVAPRFGSLQEGDGAGEPAAWLQPYATALLTEMWAIEREARAAMAQAEQFEQQVESRVRARLQGEVDREMQRKLTKVQRRLASALGDEAGALGEEYPSKRQDGGKGLWSSLALVALGAGTATYLPAAATGAATGVSAFAPTYAAFLAMLAKWSVLAKGMLCLFAGPKLLVLIGLIGAYRVVTVAHRPLRRVARACGRGVKGLWGQVTGAVKHLAFGWQPKHAHAHA